MKYSMKKPMDRSGLKWCDPQCTHASFPEAGHLGGACHTFIALYCSKYSRLVQKSARCLDHSIGTKEGDSHGQHE